MVLRTALWCVPVADLGGVARHVLDVARSGIPGWRIVVLCPEGPLAHELRAIGAPVVTGPVSPSDGTATAVRTIRRTLRRLQPDILHTHLAFADLAGIAAVQGLRSERGVGLGSEHGVGRRSGRGPGWGRRIRVLSTEHGIAGVRGYYQSSTASARAKAAAHRARLLRTDRVIAVSESTREQVAAQWGSAGRVTVVRNEVDAPGASAGAAPGPGADGTAPQPGLRILSLARLAPEKRIDQLLRAFVHVVREHPEATLTVAGTGPEEPDLRALAGILGIADRVTFAGHVDAADALRTHDVVVQLSVWENLSYTLLDAVAHGLGVVATDVGGNREIVPERCLVPGSDADRSERPTGTAVSPVSLPVQEIARMIVEQGLDVAARPRPRRGEGSVASMCAAIGDVYAEVMG